MNIHICMSGLSPHTQQMRSRRQTSTQHLWVSYTSPGCCKMLQVKQPTASWPHAEHRRSFADHHLHVVGVYCHQVAVLKICGTTSLRAILVSAVVGFFSACRRRPKSEHNTFNLRISSQPSRYMLLVFQGLQASMSA